MCLRLSICARRPCAGAAPTLSESFQSRGSALRAVRRGRPSSAIAEPPEGLAMANLCSQRSAYRMLPLRHRMNDGDRIDTIKTTVRQKSRRQQIPRISKSKSFRTGASSPQIADAAPWECLPKTRSYGVRIHSPSLSSRKPRVAGPWGFRPSSPSSCSPSIGWNSS